MIFDVVCNESHRDIPNNKLQFFAEKMYPICLPIFEKYDIEKSKFENTNDYMMLYTELTGVIQIRIEESKNYIIIVEIYSGNTKSYLL